MAEAILVKEKIDAGEWLIRAADKKKVPLRAALWVYDSTEDDWTLVLEADPKSNFGPLAFSKALHSAVDAGKKGSDRDAAKELLLFDVALYTQPHPTVEQLRASPLGEAASVSRTRLRNAMLYRLTKSQRLGPAKARSSTAKPTRLNARQSR